MLHVLCLIYILILESYKMFPRYIRIKEGKSVKINCTSSAQVRWGYRYPQLPATGNVVLTVHPYYSKNVKLRVFPFAEVTFNTLTYSESDDNDLYTLSFQLLTIKKRGYYMCFGYDNKGERFVDEVELQVVSGIKLVKVITLFFSFTK